MSYTFKKLTSSNIADLLVIYKDAFGKDVGIDYIEKKQNTSFAGLSYVGYIAYSEADEPAAFYGVFPCYAEYENKKFLVAQSGDTMTHSKHTGKGLYTALAKETYNYCKSNGVHLVFGFPNRNSYPGFTRKLDWIHFDDILAYEMRVKCLPWVRLKNTFKLPQNIHNWWCNNILGFIKKGQAFESSCKSDEAPTIEHSKDFYKYKTYEKNFLINVAGMNVWLKTDEMFLLIGDIERCSPDKLIKVIDKLKIIAMCLGLPHMRFHGSRESWLIENVSKFANKMSVEYPAGGVNFSHQLPLEKMKFTMADNDTF